MLVIVGAIIVTAAVLGGFLLEGGHFHVLFQPIELLIIGGAAAGSLLIACPMSVIKQIVTQTLGTLKKSGLTKDNYIELLQCLFEICKTYRGNPLSLEPHLEKPENSEIFKKYPHVLENHHAIHFICDTLKIQVTVSPSPYDLEDLMDADLNTMHAEEHLAPAAVTKIGDAMPGLGIVAAVLGVVITMGKLTEGKEVIGHSVAAALVGTFLGILLSYGFLQPLAGKMESNIADEGKFFEVIKACLLALAKGSPPKVCAEYGRRTIPLNVRPSFEEVDKATSAGGGSAKAA